MTSMISILGELAVTVEDETVLLTSHKQRALVASLAIRHGRPRSAHALIDDVWGAAPPTTARKNLQVLVGRVRASLGSPELLRSDASGYALDPGRWSFSDHEFEHEYEAARAHAARGDWKSVIASLDVALGRWSGRAFGTLSAEHWATEHARYLDAMRVSASLLHNSARIQAGQHEQAVSELVRLVGEHPEELDLVVLLIRAFVSSGRQVDALEQCRIALSSAIAHRSTTDVDRLRELERDVLMQAPQPSGRRGPSLPQVPVPRHELVGRVDELEAISAAARGAHRLTTIVGPGGIGKTRLALEVSRGLADQLDEVAWIDLSPAASKDDVTATLLNAFGVTSAGDDPVDALLQSIGDRSLGLILDNVEQVVGCGSDIARIRDHCPRVRVLVTSRIALGVDREDVVHVSPFPLVQDVEQVDTSTLSDLDAIQLFRARAASVEGLVSEATVRDVHRICDQVDGLPLGIELAAARTRLLTPAEICEQLDRSSTFIASRSTEYPERHRSLDKVVSWSFDLLDEHERHAFCVLSLFVGGCSPDDFARVAETIDPHAAQAMLDRLVTHNLAVREHGGSGRTRMLETIAAFGRRRLSDRADGARIRESFARQMLRHAEASNTYLAHSRGTEQQLIRERANVHAAFDWALQHHPDTAADIFVALDRYLHTRGSRYEGDELGRRMLALRHDVEPGRQPRVLGLAGRMAHYRVDPDTSSELLLEAIEGARAHGDAAAEILTRIWYVECLRMAGDLDDSLAQSLDVVALAQAHGDPWLEALAIAQVGFAYMDLERAVEALETLARAQRSFRELGDDFWDENMEASILALQMIVSKNPAPLHDLAACAERLAAREYWTFSAHVESFRLRCALEVDDFDDAAQCADDLIPRVRATGEGILLMFTLACASIAYLEQGRVDEAGDAAWESLELAITSTQTLFADYSVAVLACALESVDPAFARWIANTIDVERLETIYALDQHVAGLVADVLARGEIGDGPSLADAELVDRLKIIIERVEARDGLERYAASTDLRPRA